MKKNIKKFVFGFQDMQFFFKQRYYIGEFYKLNI